MKLQLITTCIVFTIVASSCFAGDFRNTHRKDHNTITLDAETIKQQLYALGYNEFVDNSSLLSLLTEKEEPLTPRKIFFDVGQAIQNYGNTYLRQTCTDKAKRSEKLQQIDRDKIFEALLNPEILAEVIKVSKLFTK